MVRESFYPDLVINVGKMTISQNCSQIPKMQKQKEKNIVAQAACALLNSGGGVIRVEMDDKHGQPGELRQDFQESWRDLIQSPDLQTFFETKQQGKYFHIFVKSWSQKPFPGDSSPNPRLCSLETYLYCRSGTSVSAMSSTQAFRFLKSKKQQSVQRHPVHEGGPPCKTPKVEWHSSPASDPASHIFQSSSLEYGEILPFSESQFVEFKQFSTDCIKKYVKDTIPKYVSAFANSEGGYLFIGVQDKTNKVIGCAKEKVDSDSLKNVISTAFTNLPIVHFCSSQATVSYSSKFINVIRNGELYGYLCAIKVEPFCCAVFSTAPRSWQVKETEVSRLTAEKWVRMMVGPDPITELSEAFESQLSVSHAPPLCRPVYSKKGLKHKKDLQRNLFPVPKGHLEYSPRSLWNDLSSEHKELKELIREQMRPFSRGILILSRSWAVDLHLPANSNVICDALLIAQNSPPVLHTILKEQDAKGQEYCTHTALTLKQQLVNMGGYTGKVCVMTKVLCLCPQNQGKLLQGSCPPIEYPLSYSLTDPQDMETLLQALVVVLLGFRSFLSDQLGCEILHLLTAQ